MPPSQRTAAAIERLRGFRVRPERAVPIAAAVEVLRREVAAQRRAAEGIDEAWALVPADLRDAATPVSFRGGTLSVRFAHAAARARFDLWLRAGGLRLLQSHCSKPLHRVRPA